MKTLEAPRTPTLAPTQAVSDIAREDPDVKIIVAVAPMAHIEKLSVEDTLSSIVDVARAHTRTFITLAKLLVHLQSIAPDTKYYPFLKEQGVKPSTIKNATAAVRVWHGCVTTGFLTEPEFDELTFAACLTINRSLGAGPHLHRQGITLAIESAAREEADLTDIELEGNTQVIVHARGVRISGAISFEEWHSLLRKWRMCQDNWHFGLADLQMYGRAHFGHAEVAEALSELEFSRSDAATAHAIELVPEDVRQKTTLTSGHFHAIAKAGPDLTPKQFERWTQIAEKQGLDATELKRSVTAGKVVRTDATENGRNSGINTIEGATFLLSQWKKKRQAEGMDFTTLPGLTNSPCSNTCAKRMNCSC